jgi:hypothetical protein
VSDLKWSEREKKISRQLFDVALGNELAEIVADFKARAASVSAPEQLWPLESYLREKRRDIDAKYDYRYSRLLMVFGMLLRERRIEEKDLAGLSQDKVAHIRRVASL